MELENPLFIPTLKQSNLFLMAKCSFPPNWKSPLDNEFLPHSKLLIYLFLYVIVTLLLIENFVFIFLSTNFLPLCFCTFYFMCHFLMSYFDCRKTESTDSVMRFILSGVWSTWAWKWKFQSKEWEIIIENVFIIMKIWKIIISIDVESLGKPLFTSF